MKSWMYSVLSVCLATVMVATAWGVFRVMDSADQVVRQGDLMMRSIRGTTMQIHVMAQDAVAAQRRLVDSIDGVSRAAAESMSRIGEATARTMDRIADRLCRLADSLEARCGEALTDLAETFRSARAEIVPAAAAAIAAVESAARDVRPVMTEAQGVLSATRDGIASVSAETATTVASVRPLLDSADYLTRQTGDIARSGAAIAAHYERLTLSPSVGQRIRGYLQLVLSGFTLWGNIRFVF